MLELLAQSAPLIPRRPTARSVSVLREAAADSLPLFEIAAWCLGALILGAAGYTVFVWIVQRLRRRQVPVPQAPRTYSSPSDGLHATMLQLGEAVENWQPGPPQPPPAPVERTRVIDLNGGGHENA